MSGMKILRYDDDLVATYDKSKEKNFNDTD